MVLTRARQGNFDTQEVNGVTDDQQTERHHSRLSSRILYNEMEIILEFCFVLLVVSSAFILSILARKVHYRYIESNAQRTLKLQLMDILTV